MEIPDRDGWVGALRRRVNRTFSPNLKSFIRVCNCRVGFSVFNSQLLLMLTYFRAFLVLAVDYIVVEQARCWSLLVMSFSSFSFPHSACRIVLHVERGERDAARASR